MICDLKYGHGRVSFPLPSKWQVEFLEPEKPAPCPFEEALLQSLSDPRGETPLVDWLSATDDLLIIVSDITRYAGAERILPFLQKRFLGGRKTEILFAIGNHRKHNEMEKRQILSDRIYETIPSLDHDCYNERELVSLGRTTRGVEMTVNSRLPVKDAAIVIGTINFHYLAGFGGGRKNIFPGISGYETILGIHKTVFHKDKPGKDEKARAGVLDGNPMHEEIMEGLSFVDKPLFLINSVFNGTRNLMHISAGHMDAAHRAGCEWYKNHYGHPIKEKADVVIVSAGGFPRDINFIQTHKAIEHARGAIKQGGTMIVLGQCEDGLGHSDFLNWFDSPSLEEMESRVRAADQVYAQTAYVTRMKAESYNIILVSDLDEGQVRQMGMTAKRSVQEAIASVDQGNTMTCYAVPEGSSTLILAHDHRNL